MLRELQRAFARELHGSAEPDTATPPNWIVSDTLDAGQRLSVYRNNVRLSLTEALRAVYPTIEKLVGSDFFAYLAHCFIGRYPSRAGNLQLFGNQLPAFLETFEPVRSLTYLPDVARLEWAYHESFHAADSTPLNTEQLSSYSIETLLESRFLLDPSARLISSPFPLLEIWELGQAADAPEETIDISNKPEAILVIRRRREVRFERIKAPDFAFLYALQQGRSFSDAVDEGLAVDRGFDATRILRHHVSAGTLAGVVVAPQATSDQPA